MDIVISVFLLFGAVFVLLGSLGLVKLPDIYARLHGPTKATTLGVGSLLVASATYQSTAGPGLSVHEVLVLVFLFLTAPISAYLIARAALHLRLPGRGVDLPADEE
ncbi:MAG: Na+/H+ antiporter subunit G [Myxococcota bacterium]